MQLRRCAPQWILRLQRTLFTSPPIVSTSTTSSCSCSAGFAPRPDIFPENFDLGRFRGISSLRMFDDRVTAYYCGFTGADDYYARASASNVVDRISVPALIVHAANDPFIRMTPQTRDAILANPHITYIETEDGGHCAFMGKPDGNGYDGRWAEREVVDFVGRFR